MEPDEVAAFVVARPRPITHYDRQGQVVDASRYAELVADPTYRLVLETSFPVRVVTTFDGEWQGVGAPQLFQITIHGGQFDGWSQTCATESCALSCHGQVVDRQWEGTAYGAKTHDA
ncbi:MULTISPECIES: hypothetical protein [Nocardia]|uniref:hypothetical protein n=1 Tax=Nocardia TaxID=1817 RepID=UPI000D698D90|nr:MULTISPECIES: hypothetical protein [Nocardia]